MTPLLTKIYDKGDYIRKSVHFSKRSSDKAFEIVGRLTDEAYEALDITAGPEVVLDVAHNREQALRRVRYLRGEGGHD